MSLLDVIYLNTSNINNMNGMFRICYNVNNINCAGWDTNKVTRMDYMFANCQSLTSLDVGNFDTSKVTNMDAMFQYCTSLQELHIESWTLNTITQTGISTLPVGDDEKNEIYTSAYFTVPNGWTLIMVPAA
jgi:surface protein